MSSLTNKLFEKLSSENKSVEINAELLSYFKEFKDLDEYQTLVDSIEDPVSRTENLKKLVFRLYGDHRLKDLEFFKYLVWSGQEDLCKLIGYGDKQIGKMKNQKSSQAMMHNQKPHFNIHGNNEMVPHAGKQTQAIAMMHIEKPQLHIYDKDAMDSEPDTDANSREFKVFKQFYRPLAKTLWGYTDELCTVFGKDHIIVSSEEQEIMNTPRSHRIRMLLSILAKKLRTGNINVFNKVLNEIQLYKKDADIREMVNNMQAMFEALDQDKSKEKQLVKQETQSAIEQRTNQTQSSTKEKTQQSDLEYNLFMQYHSKLTRIPSLIDLTSYFVAAKIITSSDAEAVANTIIMESQTAALRKLLNKISLTLLLGHGDSKLFDKMLKVMQIYGDDAVQHLATDMLETIIKQRSAVPITSGEKIHLISNAVPVLSKTFDHNGGELIIEEHDVTITIPELAISQGEKVKVQASASLLGPYKLPDGYDLVSVFVWIEADYRFRKLVKITIPHFASIENLDQRFDVVILTADTKDLILNENGDLMLQMHESVYDYQYEVNDDYCDYYTDHFCSKCLARRRSLISRLFNRLTFSPREVLYPNRTRITVSFCVPDDYATADDLLIELCICYSLKHCLQTVHKSYKQRKMLSTKSTNVPWSIAIDNQKCQKFCISYVDCPGWKIKPIGFKTIQVSDLDFHTYTSYEDLRAQEQRHMYPPRFKLSVNCLSHGQNLDTEFKIVLENDGVLVSDEVINFPLIITKSTTAVLSDEQFTTDVTTTTTTNTTTTTGTSSASNVSLASSYQSTTASDDLSSTTMTVTTSVSSPSATDSTAITMTDRPQVKYLNRYVRDPLCAAGAVGPDKWFDLGLTLIGEGSRNNLNVMKIDQRNTYGCCDAMFSLWLQRVPDASWSQLITALRETAMDGIANDLTSRLQGNQFTTVSDDLPSAATTVATSVGSPSATDSTAIATKMKEAIDDDASI